MSDILSTDIYQINETIDNIKKRFIEDESEETLALSTYGYLGAVQSTIARGVLITAGELANEVFPSRAKFDKNILAHAISYNITDINATPSKVNCVIAFIESDILQLMGNNNTLVIDHKCKFFIEEYEFHLDYDIIISRVKMSNNEYVYTARYDISINNSISDIVNPYLVAPVVQVIDGYKYLNITCHMHQVSYTEIENKLTSSSVIENKTYEFTFEDQLCNFIVNVTENDKTTRLIPLLEGINISGVNNYCYYSYIGTDKIRVLFDSSSYIPSINATINTVIQTTKGKSGDFPYTKNIHVILESENINYRNATAMIMLQSDSYGGEDRRSTSELKKLLPKEALSKGSISVKKDLDNYFNMMNSSDNKIEIKDRTSNQFGRSFYAYIVMKDTNGIIIPTNTIKIVIAESEFSSIENGICVMRQGTYILYNSNTSIGTALQNPTQEQIDAADFIYTTPFMTTVGKSPLHVSYYMPFVNSTPILYFKDINPNTPISFISTNISWKREFLTDSDLYKMTINLVQNVDVDMGMVKEIKDNTDAIIDIECNLRVICILYNGGNTVYRFAEAELISYDLESFKYTFQLALETNDTINEDNLIKIINVNNLSSGEEAYGYFTSDIGMDIYILGKFDVENGRYDLDNYVPNLSGYTVCNIYNVDGGVRFFTNYSENITSFIKPSVVGSNSEPGFTIEGMPVVKYSYIQNEDNITTILKQLETKKLYIDNAITVLENNFGIDFKFFNTYGPSRTYSLPNGNMLNKVNIDLKFRIKLLPNIDKNTISYIIRDVKNMIEDINNINSVHMTNIISTIEKDYISSVEYFEFLGFNGYGPGIQHIYRESIDDVVTIPELVNIEVDETTLEPKITIEVET